MTEIIVIALIVFAIHYTMQDGEIFSFLGDLFNRLPRALHNPTYECPVCMTPWYGSALYWLVFHVSIIDWIVTVIAAMGLNAVILKLAPDKDVPFMGDHIAEEIRLFQQNQNGWAAAFHDFQKEHLRICNSIEQRNKAEHDLRMMISIQKSAQTLLKKDAVNKRTRKKVQPK